MEGIPGSQRVDAAGVAQGAGGRFELGFGDVVGVAATQDVDVQGHFAVEGGRIPRRAE